MPDFADWRNLTKSQQRLMVRLSAGGRVREADDVQTVYGLRMKELVDDTQQLSPKGWQLIRLAANTLGAWKRSAA